MRGVPKYRTISQISDKFGKYRDRVCTIKILNMALAIYIYIGGMKFFQELKSIPFVNCTYAQIQDQAIILRPRGRTIRRQTIPLSSCWSILMNSPFQFRCHLVNSPSSLPLPLLVYLQGERKIAPQSRIIL